ncbi:MAG: hypothetical protein ACRD0A_07265 [Acidimicrobiales bacterium]
MVEYAAWEWTPVSCYAQQTTWRLEHVGEPARFLKINRAGAYPGLVRRRPGPGGQPPTICRYPR